MRATERYERAWNAFQIHLNHNPKASLIPFLRIPVDTRSLIPVISVHSISNLQYRRQS